MTSVPSKFLASGPMDISAGAGPSTMETGVRTTTVQAGHTVLLKLPTGDVRSIKLETDSTVTLGRFGSFPAKELIGNSYGLTYEIVDRKLKVMPPLSIDDVEDTDATNELINDGQLVQPLTSEEIDALKKSGVHASEIVKKQVALHATYALKTEYSKDKYKKRKEAKYSKFFTVIEPTLYNVCNFWFDRDQTRVRDLRSDSLSQMLNLANVRPGGRYLVVDDASGIVVAAVLERLGGQGRLLTICDVDSTPTYPALAHMCFNKDIVTPVLTSLNWATADEEYTPIVASTEPPSGDVRSERQRSRLSKRKVANNALANTREELFDGEFDGLLVASEYDVFSILEQLTPYLAGSASIVVHSPHVQIVTELQSKLRELPQYLGPAVTEAWLRQYQVLPGRTHPMMVMSGSGGFLLHVIKVYDDPDASSVMLHRKKKAKATAEDSVEQSGSGVSQSDAEVEDMTMSGQEDAVQ